MQINDLDSLRLIIQDKIATALDVIAIQIQDDLFHCIQEEYYDKFEPKSYKRTGQFLNSATKSEVRFDGKTLEIEIYVDYDSLDYAGISGENMVKLAARGYHGFDAERYYRDGFFWDKFKELYPEERVKKMIIDELTKQGMKM